MSLQLNQYLMFVYCVLGTMLNAGNIKLNRTQFSKSQLEKHISEQPLDSEAFDECKCIDSFDKCQRSSICDEKMEMHLLYIL